MLCYTEIKEEEYKLTNFALNEGRDQRQDHVPCRLSDAAEELRTHSALVMIKPRPRRCRVKCKNRVRSPFGR